MKRMCDQAKVTGQPLDIEKCLQLYQYQTVDELHVKANIGRLSASVVSLLTDQKVDISVATATNAVENNLLFLAAPLAADAFMAFLATPAGMALVATTMAITLTAAHKLGQHLKERYEKSKMDPVPDNPAWTDQGLQTEPGKATVLETPVHEGEPLILSTPVHDAGKTEQEGYQAAPPYNSNSGGFQPYDGPNANVLISERKEWQVKNYDKVIEHPVFGKFYRTPGTLEWWAKDKAGHGGSVWKVFEEKGKGLEWKRDATKFGDFLKNKHKSDTGKYIPWKDFNVSK